MTTWSDHPSADDSLDRARLVDALHDMLKAPGLATPLVVGLYGGWGMGKTSVMGMLRDRLTAQPQPPLTLWFDAWKYARSESALWRALLLEVVEALGRQLPERMEREEDRQALEVELELLRATLYRSQTVTDTGDLQVNWQAAVPLAVGLGLRLASFGLADKLGLDNLVNKAGKDAEQAMKVLERRQIVSFREHIQSLEQFQKTLDGLIEREVRKRGLTLHVFIDDLDRCLPEEALGALEAVKLFLDLKGCVFILGMDRDVVERAIRTRFPPITEPDGNGGDKLVSRVDPRQYLDKIIQLPVTLPPLSPGQIGYYLSGLLDPDKGFPPALAGCRDLIEIAAPPNPRTLKRVLNVLALLLRLDSGGADAGRARLLAKVVLIQVLFDDAWRRVVEEPAWLLQLEKAAKGEQTPHVPPDLLKDQPRLKALMREAPLFSAVPGDRLEGLIAQTKVTA
jgi:hypothetical protein